MYRYIMRYQIDVCQCGAYACVVMIRAAAAAEVLLCDVLAVESAGFSAVAAQKRTLRPSAIRRSLLHAVLLLEKRGGLYLHVCHFVSADEAFFLHTCIHLICQVHHATMTQRASNQAGGVLLHRDKYDMCVCPDGNFLLLPARQCCTS